MKYSRLVFCSLFVIFLPGFSCVKKTGVQIDTFVLSKCPESGYVLPNFSETDDLILTKDGDARTKCEAFKAYTIMNKEKINPDSLDFSIQLSTQPKCSIRVLTPRYCPVGPSDCRLTIARLSNSYGYDIKKLIPQFLFPGSNIVVTDVEQPILVTGKEFEQLCEH